MTRSLELAGAAAAILLGAATAAPAAEFETFGSPVRYGGPSLSNVTCYFTNFGGKTIHLRDLKIFDPAGTSRTLAANTCGDVGDATLPPLRTCYIGLVRRSDEGAGYGCGALAERGVAVRGELELRDADAKVLFRSELTTAGGDSATEFSQMASAPAFGGGGQDVALCLFTNLGTTAAKVTDARFQFADGSTTPAFLQATCPFANEVVIPPGGSCAYQADISEQAVQCRARVTRRANIRAILSIVKAPLTLLNFMPLE